MESGQHRTSSRSPVWWCKCSNQRCSMYSLVDDVLGEIVVTRTGTKWDMLSETPPSDQLAMSKTVEQLLKNRTCRLQDALFLDGPDTREKSAGVLGKNSQNENEGGALLDEHRNRYSQCERWTHHGARYVWNSAFHVPTASTTNTNQHTGSENVEYVNSSSYKYRHLEMDETDHGERNFATTSREGQSARAKDDE